MKPQKSYFDAQIHDPSGSVPSEEKKGFLRELAREAKSFFSKIEKDHRIRYVGNGLFGPETVNLEEIHGALGKADAFVFLPSNDLDHDLKLLSMFVAVQTGDENMFTTKIDGKKRQKPVLVVGDYDDPGYEWKPVLDLINHTAYISDDHKENIIIPIKELQSRHIVAGIELALEREKVVKPHEFIGSEPANDVSRASDREEPKFKVCVFCSASRTYFTTDAAGNTINDDDHNLAYQLGAELARKGYGVVTGAGRSNMMGSVVRGAQSAGGWTAGSNTPVIRQIEHLPDGLDAYIDRPDIYKRMKVMIEGSDAFVIAPGGAGSIQEFLALIHYKKRGNPLMKDKPVVILNPKDKDGKGYWDPLIKYAEHRKLQDMFEVANTVEEAEKKIGQKIHLMPEPLSTSWHAMVEQQRERPAEQQLIQAI